SIETCSSMEASWPERGYYLVEVDTTRAQELGTKHIAQLHQNARRPFYRFTIKTDLFTTPDALCDHCSELLARRARELGARRGSNEARPLVELHLSGVLAFDNQALDLDRIEQIVNDAFDPLYVLL